MIETIIRDYLITELTVPVYVDVPAEPPEDYVVIERTGGGIEDHIRNAMVAIQSYGARRYTAAELHERVIAVMQDLITLDEVSSCDLNSEYDFTDTATKRYRYQSVFNIVYY